MTARESGPAAALTSSNTDEWPTEAAVVDCLNMEFGPFTLDPCATDENAKASRFFTRHDNGLAQSWAGERVFMNPPYGRAVREWIEKAHTEARIGGARVVCLIPARTDTRYWHEFVMRADQILFVAGRLRFGDSTRAAHAPFPSAIVVFDGHGDATPAVSSWVRPSDRGRSTAAEKGASWAPDYGVPENISPFKPLPTLKRCRDCGAPLDTMEAMTQARDGRAVSPLCRTCVTPPGE